MDPTLDPPPAAAQPAVAVPAAAAVSKPAQAAGHNHPPYAEMISAAVASLKERDGSSKRAIAKYIDTHYSDLPPTHSALLTHHLKRLKSNGQLLMVKHSYKLPAARSAPPSVNGALRLASASAVVKRRPGRPAKPKPDAAQPAVPVFPPPINVNAAPVFAIEAQPAVNGATLSTPVRGRGRPPKQGGTKSGPGRPPKSGGGGSGVSRGRGRPKKNAVPVSTAVPAAVGRGKRPGRPRKSVNVVGGFAPAAPLDGRTGAAPPAVSPPSTGKRRGRPPKAGNETKKARHVNAAIPKTPRKLSGKPLGRPRKNSEETGNQSTNTQLIVAYLDLKVKLENLQSTVKQTVSLVRPSLNNDAAINAIQELELVALNAGAPPDDVSTQQQPPPDQDQPRS